MAKAQKLETVELVGPAGRIIVNKSDADPYLQKGYKPAPPDRKEPVEPPAKPPIQVSVGDEVTFDTDDMILQGQIVGIHDNGTATIDVGEDKPMNVELTRLRKVGQKVSFVDEAGKHIGTIVDFEAAETGVFARVDTGGDSPVSVVLSALNPEE